MKVARWVLRRAALGNKCRLSDINELKVSSLFCDHQAILSVKLQSKKKILRCKRGCDLRFQGEESRSDTLRTRDRDIELAFKHGGCLMSQSV
ncbi:hypothetical protein FS418_04510 [Shewanella sp. YLB-09]|uniref:Uncharacterized protein n=1 Tax=Shewanella eurypsychrophilus TaxID=2593656 RepID=A0A550ABV4_9GAMM|nr:hypothetical protein FS418_04510 [Shewanella sp. YLB-09]